MHHQTGVNFENFTDGEIPGHFANRDETPGHSRPNRDVW